MLIERFAVAFAALLLILIYGGSYSSFAQPRVNPYAETVHRTVATLCRTQVVALGELPSHGEAKTFQAKAEIVRRLVEECSFNTVLFEAPIYDFVGFETAVAEGRATQAQLDRAIGRFWMSRELADWRRWLFERASIGRLNLGGLDDQVSMTSDYARANLPRLVEAAVPAGGPKGCAHTVERHLYWRYDASHPYDESEQMRLYSCTRSAADRVVHQRMAPWPSADYQMLSSLVRYVKRQRGTPTAEDRDHAMYINFAWYDGRRRRARKGVGKVIIWTATVHAARTQGALPEQPLGEWLARQYGDRFAAVGFAAFSGMSSMAGRPSQPIQEAPPESLEARSTKDRDWAFLNSSQLRKIGPVPSRLMGKFIGADWSSYFDAVVVVREEAAPIFEP